jgi:hypothetical protein
MRVTVTIAFLCIILLLTHPSHSGNLKLGFTRRIHMRPSLTREYWGITLSLFI